MFGEDRFGPTAEFSGTYRALGGRALPSDIVDQTIRAVFQYLHVRYLDPAYQDTFPTLAEAFQATAPDVGNGELELLERTFAAHERGSVPAESAAALRALSTTRELRLLTNIWAQKDSWLEELARVGVLACFQRMIFSSDTRSVKPSQLLMDQILDGVTYERSEILMVGDSLERDMLPARQAGVATLWITGNRPPGVGGHAVDYRESSLTALVAPPDETRTG